MNASTNIFNCRFRCHHGEATLLHTILTVYFLWLHAEAACLWPFSTAYFPGLEVKQHVYVDFFCLFGWSGGEEKRVYM